MAPISRGFGALLVGFVTLNCGSGEPKTRTSNERTAPRGPTVKRAPSTPSRSETSHDAPSTAEPTHQIDEITLDNCASSKEQRRACAAMGTGCFLDAEPVLGAPHPCANRGARCMEDLSLRTAQQQGPCMCSCDPKYKKMRQDLENALYERRNPGTDLVEPCHVQETGSKRTAVRCTEPEPPELPR